MASAMVASANQVVPVIQVQGANSGAAGNYTSRNSELILMVQQLQDEVRQLRGQLEAQEYKFQKLEADQKRRYRDMDRRISALLTSQTQAPDYAAGAPVNPATAPASTSDTTPAGTPGASTSTTSAPFSAEQALATAPSSQANVPVPSVGQSSQAPVSQAPVSQPVALAPAPAVDEVAAQTAYQDAFGLVRKREFETAAEKFEDFVGQYSGSVRIPNAYYWLGEIYLALGVHDKSETAFLEVLNKYSDNSKAADSMYKLGVLKKQMGQREKYLSYMSQVINDYPGTRAARLAESSLSQ